MHLADFVQLMDKNQVAQTEHWLPLGSGCSVAERYTLLSQCVRTCTCIHLDVHLQCNHENGFRP